MGAKLSRRKSESAAGVEGVAAEIPATEEPETVEALAVTENNEQKSDEAEDVAQRKATEMAPVVVTAPSQSASDAGTVETMTQAVEEIMSSVSKQVAGPVEDIVNKGIAAVEAMMAEVSVKNDPTELAAEVPDTESKAEPLVDLSAAKSKFVFSLPNPPEEPVQLLAEPSALEDLMSQPIAESLSPEPVSAATVTDISPVALEDEGFEIEIDMQAPLESEEPLVCIKWDAAPAEDPLNCEAGAVPTTLNSDPLVVFGDLEQAVTTAVNTVDDLI